MRRILALRRFVIAALVVVVAAAGAAIAYQYFGKRDAAPALQTAATAAGQPPVHDDDHVMGKADAPITMVEYASFTCPHCAHFHNDVLPQIESAYIDTGKVRLVFRDFPLDEAALRASQLTQCVSPLAYFPMVSLLFKEQGNWAHGDDPLKGLAQIAAGAGLDQAKFQACLDDKTTSDRIIARAQEAQEKYGVDSTPTFFINGRKVSGALPFEDFEKIFKELLP
jgi:protein-disulfide isomerase